ncbi:hypothetical protein FB645_003195 [Coemansia sp. IMI 203386]|nr:hypothetical protein FB645_003195 [Coemansia sp. IMI 203386]
MNNTILLLQRSESKDTRTYETFDSPEKALEEIILMFKARLMALCPTAPHIKYSIEDLNRYIDKHQECRMLVLDSKSNSYMARDAQWIKASIKKVAEKVG